MLSYNPKLFYFRTFLEFCCEKCIIKLPHGLDFFVMFSSPFIVTSFQVYERRNCNGRLGEIPTPQICVYSWSYGVVYLGFFFKKTCLSWCWSKTRSLYSANTIFFGGSLSPSTSYRYTDSEFPFSSAFTFILLKQFGEPKLTGQSLVHYQEQ